MTRQDNTIEKEQCKALGLTHIDKRSNRYIHDGELLLKGKVYKAELKSSNLDKSTPYISTGRDFGLEKIETWKKEPDFFIFTGFSKTTGKREHIFCFPTDLQPFYDSVSKKVNEGSRTWSGLNEWRMIKKQIILSGLSIDINKAEKTWTRGSKLNDPRIRWADVVEWGIKLNKKNPAAHLRKIVGTL